MLATGSKHPGRLKRLSINLHVFMNMQIPGLQQTQVHEHLPAPDTWGQSEMGGRRFRSEGEIKGDGRVEQRKNQRKGRCRW